MSQSNCPNNGGIIILHKYYIFLYIFIFFMFKAGIDISIDNVAEQGDLVLKVRKI